MPVLVENNEVYMLSPGELRFREACLHYTLYMENHGPAAGLKDNTFRWMSHADAFLMSLVSLPDMITPRPALHKSDVFRFLKVMRNITVHQAVVVSTSPYFMVNRVVHLTVGGVDPDRPDHEDPIIVASSVKTALANYETNLRTMPKGKNKDGSPRTMWDNEKATVEAARRWNEELSKLPDPRARISDVFFKGLKFVGAECRFTLPELPLPPESAL